MIQILQSEMMPIFVLLERAVFKCFHSAHPTGWAESITIHILKAYDESYSKTIRGHKYKDKDTDIVPEMPNICYIIEILITHSFQI